MILIALVCVLPEQLYADRVALKSGMVYHDVRAEPTGHAHRVTFYNGRIIFVPNSLIRSVRPGPITWRYPPVPPSPIVQPENRPVDPPPEIVKKIEPRPLPLPGSDWGPILKSAVLPGWGQYSLGEERKGSLFAAGSFLLFYRYWTLRQQHSTAEAEYNDPLPVGLIASQSLTGAASVLDVTAINLVYLSNKESEVLRLQNQANQMVALMTLLWGWNMLDITCRGEYVGRCGFGMGTRASGHLPTFIPGFYLSKDSVSASFTLFL